MTADRLLVVPVFRGWAHVRALLDGLPAQEGVRIVVVDDASGDGGAEALRRDRPDIDVVVRTTNDGFAAAVNTGLASGAWAVAVVANSDTLINPEVLHSLFARAAAEPDAIVGPAVTAADGRVFAPRTMPLVPDALRRPLRRAGRLVPGRRPETGCLSGACLAFSRAVFDRTGPFDEGFGMYSEDVEWQIRAARAGVRRIFATDLAVFHDAYHGRAADRATVAARQHQIALSRLRLARIAYGPGGWAVYRGLLAIGGPVAALAALARRRRPVSAPSPGLLVRLAWLRGDPAQHFRMGNRELK